VFGLVLIGVIAVTSLIICKLSKKKKGGIYNEEMGKTGAMAPSHVAMNPQKVDYDEAYGTSMDITARKGDDLIEN